MLKSYWEVLVLFLIPIGGGIPAGVVLAHSRGIGWPIMMVLYFISDVILACLFEPITWAFLWAAKRNHFLARFTHAMKKSTNRTVSKYGISPGPFTLIMISFGIDPMTGRSAALAAGHRFISGWAIAITGDMFFFAVIMGSTLWLNNILGDGTWTAVIIMLLMMVAPGLIRRVREALQRSEPN